VDRLEQGPPRHDLRKELKKYAVVNRLEDVAPGMAAFLADQVQLQRRGIPL